MLKKLKQLWTYRKEYVAYTRKAILNVTTLASSLLALGYLHDPYVVPVTITVGVLGVIAHFEVSNGDAPVIPPDS